MPNIYTCIHGVGSEIFIQVTVKNMELTVYCNHEERSDSHGRVSRSVLRTYHLPNDVDEKTVKSKLDDKGVLHVTASKKKWA